MLKAFFTIDDEDPDLPDETGIDWLDIALTLAQIIVAHIIQDIEDPKLAESG